MLSRFYQVLCAVCVVLGLFAASPDRAQASAVKGCSTTGEVLEVVTDTSGAAPEVSLKLKVISSEEFGHSAGPALCPKPEDELMIALDNDPRALSDKVAIGDIVNVEEMTVYNVTAEGRSVHHSKTYEGRAPSPDPASSPP